LWLLCLALPAQAALQASVDRDRIALGDTLRLTITATENDSLEQLNLRPLGQEFELLQRSTSSSTNIVNGRATHTRQLLIDMTPKRQGSLRIPPLRSRTGETNMLLIAVGPPATAGDGTNTVLFEAEVDRDSVYVQGQVVLTLRVQQAINLDSRGISELQLDNAFVKPLEQKSFQRTVDGRPWLVNEIRYAIFPEQSGELVIPAQSFSARESSPRRSFFDRNSGRQLRRSTEEIRIQVKPRPAGYPAGTWLPASQLEIEEQWSTPPEQLRAGESATRTVIIRGAGLQGAQLPPVSFEPVAGVQYYPDQPQISDREIASGLLAERSDSAALIATSGGEWEIPEVRIPWWDTASDSLQYAVLPARKLIAQPAATPLPAQHELTTAAIPLPTQQANDTPSAISAGWWPVLTAVTSLGWVLTLIYLIYSRRRPSATAQSTEPSTSEKALLKQLLEHCQHNRAEGARWALQRWCASHLRQPALTLAQALHSLQDAPLSTAAKALDEAVYGGDATNWQGEALAQAVTQVSNRKVAKSTSGNASTPPLYPTP
jgi:hypothetical protein